MALSISTQTDYIDFGSASSLDNLDTWTAILLTKPTGTLTAWLYLLNKCSASNAFVVHLQTAGISGGLAKLAATVKYSSSPSPYYATDFIIAADTWQWLASSFDKNAAGDLLRFWYASSATALIASQAVTYSEGGAGNPNNDGAGVVRIGKTPAGAGTGNGHPQDVAFLAIYNTRLTTAQIQAQQKAPWAPLFSGCILFKSDFGLVDGTGTQNDRSGNGNNGTVSSATVVSHPSINIIGPRSLVTSAITAAPQVITPGTADLVLTADKPILELPVDVRPGTADLVLTGNAPIVRVGINIQPGTAALTLTADKPLIELPVSVRPGTGALILTADKPIVKLPVDVRPGTAGLVLTADKPLIELPVAVRPGTAGLVLTGDKPVVELPVSARPGTADLILTGYAPVLGLPLVVQPGTAQLTLTGYEPQVVVGADVEIQPGTASLILSGGQPLLEVGAGLQPGTAALVLTGDKPILSFGTVLRPGTAALTLSGNPPKLLAPVEIQPGVARLNLDGYPPKLDFPIEIQPGTADAILTGYTPILVIGKTIIPGTAELILTGGTPLVAPVDYVIIPGTAALLLGGNSPRVEAAVSRRPGTGALAFTGYPPIIRVGKIIQPLTAWLALTGYPPIVPSSVGPVIRPGTAWLALQGYPPIIGTNVPGVGVNVLGIDLVCEPLLNLALECEPVLDVELRSEPELGLELICTGAEGETLESEAPYESGTGVHIFVMPGTAVLDLTGHVPVVETSMGGAGTGAELTPGTASVILVGYPPIVEASVSGGDTDIAPVLTPGTASLMFAGHDPLVVVAPIGFLPPNVLDLNLVGAYIDGGGVFRRSNGTRFSPSVWNAWINDEVIGDDNLGLGMNRVVRIHYHEGALDRAFGFEGGPIATLGQQWFAAGDFAFDSAHWLLAGGKLEQLLGTAHGCQYVVYFRALNGQIGTQVVVNNYDTLPRWSGNGRWDDGSKDITPAVFLQALRKYHYERRIRINSAYGVPDGELQLWLDGVCILDEKNIPWYRVNNGEGLAYGFSFGTQVNKTSGIFSVYRQWSNVKVSTTRIG